jgi:biopolymer transport protein ExbD
MNLRPRAREEIDINLAPFIDVVFLLLIFFMVSTTFLKEGNLELTLPEASPTPTEARSDVMELVIDAKGNYALEGRALANRQPDTVRRALEQAYGEGGQTLSLIIRADAETPHQAVVTALDAAGQAGIKQLGIATVPEEEKH